MDQELFGDRDKTKEWLTKKKDAMRRRNLKFGFGNEYVFLMIKKKQHSNFGFFLWPYMTLLT